MKLNYKKMGSGPALIVLHGLFGMLDNWQSIGRELSKDFEVWLVDQRNHGRSPHRDQHNYDAMADDLEAFIEEHALEGVVVIGHSMGGKTAMRLAQKSPELLLGIIVVDMGIKEYPIHHDTIVEALKDVPVESIDSRSEAEDYLAQNISEAGVRQFLLKNLHRKQDGGYEWRFNLKVLEREMNQIVDALPKEKVEIPVLFIRGKNSDYISDSDIPNLQELFVNSKIETLDTGHWVHAEKPKEVIRQIRSFIG